MTDVFALPISKPSGEDSRFIRTLGKQVRNEITGSVSWKARANLSTGRAVVHRRSKQAHLFRLFGLSGDEKCRGTTQYAGISGVLNDHAIVETVRVRAGGIRIGHFFCVAYRLTAEYLRLGQAKRLRGRGTGPGNLTRRKPRAIPAS